MRLRKRLESRLSQGCRMQRAFISALTILSTAILITMPVAYAQTLNWETVTGPTTAELRSVFCVSSTDCWAVGEMGTSGTMQGTIVHWSGTSWAMPPQSELVPLLNSVFCVNANDCWAVGDQGKTFRWNGASWSTVASPTTDRLNSVFCVSANDCWAVGQIGAIIRWGGTSWSTVISSHPVGRPPLYSVFCASSADCWAVGEHGTIVHWAGSSWSTVTSPTSRDIYSAFCINANDCRAVGQLGTIIRWNGASWSMVTNQTRDFLASVFCVSSSDCWAVGGTNIHQWSMSSWSTVPSPSSFYALHSISCISANDCWAVGQFGTIIHGRSSATPRVTTTPISPSPATGVQGVTSNSRYTFAGVVAAILLIALIAVAFLLSRRRTVRPDLRSKPSQAAANPARFCTNCGRKISRSERFCANCGTRQQ